MDEINQNQTPLVTESKGSVGPLIGSIIVIIILVIGAIYFWGDTMNKQNEERQTSNLSLANEQDASTLEDDLNAIPEVKADINNL
jgi:flagellar basal body-associated protein FliL